MKKKIKKGGKKHKTLIDPKGMREMARVRREDLAARAGVSYNTICRYEKLRQWPRQMMVRLAWQAALAEAAREAGIPSAVLVKLGMQLPGAGLAAVVGVRRNLGLVQAAAEATAAEMTRSKAEAVTRAMLDQLAPAAVAVGAALDGAGADAERIVRSAVAVAEGKNAVIVDRKPPGGPVKHWARADGVTGAGPGERVPAHPRKYQAKVGRGFMGRPRKEPEPRPDAGRPRSTDGALPRAREILRASDLRTLRRVPVEVVDDGADDAAPTLPKRKDASQERRGGTRTVAGPQKLMCPPRVPAPTAIRAKAPALSRDGVWTAKPAMPERTAGTDNDGDEVES